MLDIISLVGFLLVVAVVANWGSKPAARRSTPEERDGARAASDMHWMRRYGQGSFRT